MCLVHVPVGPASATHPRGEPFQVPFSVTLPPRWSLNGSGRGYADFVLQRGPDSTPAYVTLFVPLDAYADPCHPDIEPTTPPVGPSVEDLTEALTGAAGFTAGPVTDIDVDGHPGTLFDLDNAIDISTRSDKPWLPQWTYDSSNGENVVESDASSLSGTHQRIAIVDVDGTQVLILAWTLDPRSEEVVETWQVMESIDFQ